MDVLFINATDIAALEQVSYKTAYKRIQQVCTRLKIPKTRDISLRAYCECYYLREEQVSRKVVALRAQLKNSA